MAIGFSFLCLHAFLEQLVWGGVGGKMTRYKESEMTEPLIKWLNNKHKTILSCCGHGKYPMSVIVKEYTELKGQRAIVFREIISGMILRVKENALDKDPKKFYKKDKQGVYYIPEIIEQLNRKEGKE